MCLRGDLRLGVEIQTVQVLQRPIVASKAWIDTKSYLLLPFTLRNPNTGGVFANLHYI